MDEDSQTREAVQTNRRQSRWRVVAARIGVLVVIVATVIAAKVGCDRRFGVETLRANAKDLGRTVITPHLEARIEPGRNLLWCSTFQLVWNEARRYAGGDIHLAEESAIVAILNKKAASEADVASDGCVILSGQIERGIFGEIRKEVESKFGRETEPELLNGIENSLPDKGFLAYAMIFRQLPFEYPLKRFDEPFDFGGAKVASFGLRDLTSRKDDVDKAKQVVVLSYKNKDDFIVELMPDDKVDRIILAKVLPSETLQGTIKSVYARASHSSPEAVDREFNMEETIVIPILDFELLRRYHEIENKVVTTPGPLWGEPLVALQNIRFRLDEQGAILKSEAIMYKCAGGLEPRQFIFDRPFLILLERRGAERPYFALWVDNAEILALWR